MTTRASMFAPGVLVTVDEYGPNPAAADLHQAHPVTQWLFEDVGGPPALFDPGPLPGATASGIDPADLAAVPWSVRHVIAREDDAAIARDLLEQWTPHTAETRAMLAAEAEVHHYDPANVRHANALRDWARVLLQLRADADTTTATDNKPTAAELEELQALGFTSVDDADLASYTEHVGLTWRELIATSPTHLTGEHQP